MPQGEYRKHEAKKPKKNQRKITPPAGTAGTLPPPQEPMVLSKQKALQRQREREASA